MPLKGAQCHLNPSGTTPVEALLDFAGFAVEIGWFFQDSELPQICFRAAGPMLDGRAKRSAGSPVPHNQNEKEVAKAIALVAYVQGD
jgi:hypothetical protein